MTIEEVLKWIDIWLTRDVQPYLDDQNTIDIWEEYKHGIKHLKVEILNTSDNSRFSADDIIRIRFAVQDLKGLIQHKFDVTSEQMMIVNEKLDYLVNVARIYDCRKNLSVKI